jgi:phospholipase/carboxylesterase
VSENLDLPQPHPATRRFDGLAGRRSMEHNLVGSALTRLRVWERPGDGEPAGALVLLHGRGGNEHDFSRLFDDVDPQHRLHAFVPRGPVAVGDGRADWFDYELPGSVERAASAMHAWLDTLPFPRERIVLGGWSQGGAMAYVLGLSARRPRPAALVPLGAFPPLWEGWEPNLEPPLPPVAIGHGTNDKSVPVGWARVARRLLEAAGAEVAYRESPVGHEIDSAWLSEARVLIERVTPVPG